MENITYSLSISIPPRSRSQTSEVYKSVWKWFTSNNSHHEHINEEACCSTDQVPDDHSEAVFLDSVFIFCSSTNPQSQASVKHGQKDPALDIFVQ